MLQNEGFGRLIAEYLHHGWRQFLDFVVLNAPEWRIWTASEFYHHVWRKFWFSWSEVLQNWGLGMLISEYIHQGWRRFLISSPWLKKILLISWSGMLQNEGFGRFMSEYLNHGWRKFLIFVVWNASEWRIWNPYLRIYSPRLKKIFDFRDLECPRMKDLNHLLQNIFTMVEENFWFSWSEMLQNGGFGMLISEYIHQGWRKFLIFVMWNAPEWRIWTAYTRISSPWLKKTLIFVVWSASEWRIWNPYLRIYSPRLKNIFDFRDLECPRMKDLNHLLQNIRISSPWLKKIFDFRGLEWSRTKDLDSLCQNIFTMVEENFQFYFSFFDYLFADFLALAYLLPLSLKRPSSHNGHYKKGHPNV